jgi:hypothetical protein
MNTWAWGCRRLGRRQDHPKSPSLIHQPETQQFQARTPIASHYRFMGHSLTRKLRYAAGSSN